MYIYDYIYIAGYIRRFFFAALKHLCRRSATFVVAVLPVRKLHFVAVSCCMIEYLKIYRKPQQNAALMAKQP